MKDTLNLRVPANDEVFAALRSERDAALRDLAAAHVVNKDFLDALAAARAERDDLKHDMERLQTANSEQLAELAAACKDAERRLRLLRLHHSDAMELWKALTDLSFECDNVIATYDGKVGAPTIETYNRTFDVIAKHRAAYSEEARNACMQGNTITAAIRGAKP